MAAKSTMAYPIMVVAWATISGSTFGTMWRTQIAVPEALHLERGHVRQAALDIADQMFVVGRAPIPGRLWFRSPHANVRGQQRPQAREHLRNAECD